MLNTDTSLVATVQNTTVMSIDKHNTTIQRQKKQTNKQTKQNNNNNKSHLKISVEVSFIILNTARKNQPQDILE